MRIEFMKNTKTAYKRAVIKNLKDLGIYKDEYEDMIDIYSGMIFQYATFEKAFEESGFKVEEEYTNKAGATNMRKVPLYTAMESLRKDIATYSDKLGLNPKSLESISQEKLKFTGLDEILSNL